MRWIMALLAVFSTTLVIMPAHYHCFGHISRFWGQFTKLLPTLMCALFAGAAYLTGRERYSLLIFIGLCICTVADVMLGVHFVTGGALFFLGHMFYIAALCMHQAPTKWSIPVFAIALGLLWLFLFKFKPRIYPPLLFRGVQLYSAALAMLLCLSIPMPFMAFSQRTLLAALGAVIFVLSDMGVCHAMLSRIPRALNAFYLGIYYLAQLLLALSAF